MRIEIEGFVLKTAKMQMRTERILIAPMANKRSRAARSFPTVTHRFYYWIHKQIPSGPLRGARNREKRSANALLTGIQHTGSGQQAVQPLHGGLHEGLK